MYVCMYVCEHVTVTVCASGLYVNNDYRSVDLCKKTAPARRLHK